MEAAQAAPGAFGVALRHGEGTFNRSQEGRCAAAIQGWAAVAASLCRAKDETRAAPTGSEKEKELRELCSKLERDEAREWRDLGDIFASPLFGHGLGPWPFDGRTNRLVKAVLQAQSELRCANGRYNWARHHTGWGRSRVDREPYRARAAAAEADFLAAREELALRIDSRGEPTEFERMVDAELGGRA
jgi:hypothetical protein